jgi:hypothetical protein
VSGNRQIDWSARDDGDGLYADLERWLAIQDPDAVLRRGVELARDIIGLVRVSFYVRGQGRHFLWGTWGSDSRGAIVDEHHVLYATNELDTTPPDHEAARYSVFEDCLLVEHGTCRTDVAARGWVTRTPIRYGQSVIGLMFNDAGPGQAAFDEVKQAQAAILCSLLGAALGPLAGAHEVGAVTTDGRNRLRLDCVAFLMASGGTCLADAAIAAGFASQAEFQRVSRMFRRTGALRPDA